MKFKIPFKTPSVNHLYFNFRNRRILTKDARNLKKEIFEIVTDAQHSPINPVKLQIKVDVYENWYNKDGTVKRKDISNREKFLIDSIFDALGIDDKLIFKHEMNKIQSDKEYTIVEIKEWK